MVSTASCVSSFQAIRAHTKPEAHQFFLGDQWWNVNVPEQKWTSECPDFLIGQEKKNIDILSTKDGDHPRMSWDEVKGLIDTNRINHFHRMPSDLRRYIKYCYDLNVKFGSILQFMQYERLKWPSVEPSGNAPFSHDADYTILYNDWPYSVEENITHVVVWTKFALEDDPANGFLSEESRLLVEDFVVKTFCHYDSDHAVMDRSQLRWFKNWRSLRSVHALEHFHVMLYNAPQDLLDKVTHNDVPMCELFEAS